MKNARAARAAGPSPRRAHPAGQVAVTAVGLFVAGCTAQPAPSPAAGPPAVSLPQRSRAAQPDDRPVEAVHAAVAAYRGMWQAYQSAAQVPDASPAALTRFATAAALQTITDGLRSLQARGLKGTGVVSHTPRATALTPAAAPTQVDITDCMDTSTSHVVRAGPGPAYRDSPGGRRLCLATVRRQGDGAWKVVTFAVQPVGTC